MSVAVSLPEDVVALALDEGGELEHAVAGAVVFYHYGRGRLSAGKAAQLLGMDRTEFEHQRIARGVDRPFEHEDLMRDLDWVKTQIG